MFPWELSSFLALGLSVKLLAVLLPGDCALTGFIPQKLLWVSYLLIRTPSG